MLLRCEQRRGGVGAREDRVESGMSSVRMSVLAASLSCSIGICICICSCNVGSSSSSSSSSSSMFGIVCISSCSMIVVVFSWVLVIVSHFESLIVVDRSTFLIVLVLLLFQLQVRVCALSFTGSGGSRNCVEFVGFRFRLILFLPGNVINTTPSLNFTLHNRTPHPE